MSEPEITFQDKIKKNTKWFVIFSIVLSAFIGLGELLDTSFKLSNWLFPKPDLDFEEKYSISASDFNNFKEIEKRLFVPYNAEIDTAKYSSFKDYFFNENSGFFKELEKASKSTILFVAPAGAGKSFFARELEKMKSGHFVKIDLNEIADRKNLNPKYFEFRNDLEPSNSSKFPAFSKMPALKNDVKFDINVLFELAKEQIDITKPNHIIIDDFDEIHPSFAIEILKQIRNFKLNNTNSKVDFYLFGRPEGFKNFFLKQGDNNLETEFYEMKPPKFLNKGDIEVVISNYNNFHTPRVDLYQTKENLSKLMNKFKFLSYTRGNLNISNIIVQESSKLKDYSEEELKDRLFASIMENNAISHGRPDKDNSLYVAILTQIAKRYFSKLDENGYFEVLTNDEVTLDYKQSNGDIIKLTYKVQDFLDRSGISYLQPFSFSNPRYRFEPFWIQEYLIKVKR